MSYNEYIKCAFIFVIIVSFYTCIGVFKSLSALIEHLLGIQMHKTI